MSKILSLRVFWIDNLGLWQHIGTLSRDEKGFHFHYEDLRSAKANGFLSLVEFPDQGRRYSSPKLFLTFSERLPDIRRPDLKELRSSLGLTDDSDPFEVLSRSSGALATDRIRLSI